MLFSLKVISGFLVICVIYNDGHMEGMMASVMSHQGPWEGVSNPQRLLQLHGWIDGMKMQWMTLSSYCSLMLQDLFNFCNLSLKAVLIGKQEATSGLREWLGHDLPQDNTVHLCHSSCHQGYYIGGLCARFESGINANVFFKILFKINTAVYSKL